MSQPSAVAANPCISCGACCATFRVSFYWAEAEVYAIPPALIEQVTPLYSCMAGTHAASPHCAALQGRIGEALHCSIYEHRPSPCHAVEPGDEKCRMARLHHQLPALTPA